MEQIKDILKNEEYCEIEVEDFDIPAKEQHVAGIEGLNIYFGFNLIRFIYLKENAAYAIYVLYLIVKDDDILNLKINDVDIEIPFGIEIKDFFELVKEEIMNKKRFTLEVDNSTIRIFSNWIMYAIKPDKPDDYYLKKEIIKRESVF
jgi:hypothetical protein